MTDFWDEQIERADSLASELSGSKDLLTFYAQLLRAQKKIYESHRRRKTPSLCGDLETDLPAVQSSMTVLLECVALHGPESLATEAQEVLNAEPHVVAQKLSDYWRTPAETEFFAKATFQPYLRWLAEAVITPVGREFARSERSCPFCGGKPQVSFLQSKESNAESGNRDLICATCLSSWQFRRIVCASCGEERPAQLGYYHSPEFDHVRIEACLSCMRYIKGVDLTRLGHAVPLVDDIHTAALDLWAREHGYTKIELNLVGL